MSPLFSYSYEGVLFETYGKRPLLSQLLELRQVHGDIVSRSKKERKGDGWAFPQKELKTLIPAIKTADCLPIWLVGEKYHYLIHAGWKGLKKGILNIDEPIEFALIGPSISAQSFEVQEDFYEHFPKSSFFQKVNERLTFDLKAYAMMKIQENFPLVRVVDSGICTFADSRFHSFRRDKTSLRNWSILRTLT